MQNLTVCQDLRVLASISLPLSSIELYALKTKIFHINMCPYSQEGRDRKPISFQKQWSMELANTHKG